MSTENALIPHLVVSNAKAAIEFYKAGLGAVEEHTMPSPDGRVMHSSLKIEGSRMFLCDDFPEYCGGKPRLLPAGMIPPITLHLCVANCDKAMDRMVKAGATMVMPAMDAFWGDRYGKVLDPYGIEWSFTHALTAEQKAAAEKAWAEKGMGV